MLGAAAGYGALPVLVKLALGEGARIWPLVAWRFLVAAVLVWAYLALRGRRVPSPGRLPGLFGLGLLYAVTGAAFLASLERLAAGTATLIFFTYPAVVLLLGVLFLGERLTPARAGALVLAVAGCAFTAGLGGGAVDPRGLSLVLVATAAVSLYMVASRRAMGRAPVLGAAAVVLTFTAVATAAFALVQGGLALGGTRLAAAWVGLAGAVGTAVPVTLLLVALKYLDAGKVAVYSTAEPAITVLLAAAILGERLALLQLVGAALILAGVLWLRTEVPVPTAEEAPRLDAP